MSGSMRYRLDNSGILHLAVLRQDNSNTFRMTLELDEPVDPAVLQQALDAVAPRFPVIVAGIRPGLFEHYVVPATPPRVLPDTQTMRTMSAREIRTCAMRVLYRGSRLSFECFHSLTDGYGGFAFLRALVAEYYRLAHGLDCRANPMIPHPGQTLTEEEARDDYITYAGGKSTPFNHAGSWLPDAGQPVTQTHTVVGRVPLSAALQTARQYGVSLTTLLAAVMVEAVMERQQQTSAKPLRRVQLMMPINLRRRFPSVSLRNFSLYAFLGWEPQQNALPFAERLALLDGQFRAQLTEEHLAGMMATNLSLSRHPVLRWVPLALKCAGLRFGYHFFGARNSALSLSNLGVWQFPPELAAHIREISVFLAPRVCAPYNCGAVSYGDTLAVCLCRSCACPGLEPIFFRKLAALCGPLTLEVDGEMTDAAAWLQQHTL